MVGKLDLAHAAFMARARKRPPLMPEKLGFKKIAGNGRAVDADHRAVRTRTFGMNGMGEKLLARPRGAQNQHGFIKPGIIAGLAFQPMHHPAFANQVAKGVLGRETGLHAPLVLRNFAVQMLDFAGKALKLLGIVEDGLRNHARYLAVPAPHWYAVDDYRVFVAGPRRHSSPISGTPRSMTWGARECGMTSLMSRPRIWPASRPSKSA